MDPLKFLVEIQDKASSQLDDLETKIDKVLKDRSFKISIEGIGEIKAVLSQISSTLQLTGNNDVIAKFEPRIKALKDQLNSSKDLTEQYAKLISTIENRQANLSNLLAGGNSKYFGGEKGGQLRKAIEEYQSLLEDIKTKRNEGLLSDSHLKEIQRNISSIATNYKNVEKEAAKFNKAQDNAESKIKKLGMAFNDMKAYMKTHGGSEEMRRLQGEIQTAIQKMHQLMNAGDNAGAIAVFERIKGAIRQASTATKEYERSIQQTAKATSQLTAEEQRLANALNQSSQAAKSHSQVLGDLKSLATQYLGVWGAQNFVHNIIEIGGQLEMQRMSIGAILGDLAQANDLFEKIKGMAIQSPFGVVELDQMTKQLSAYGFQSNELFDMTKRLADISAATGTGVDRLALALGHVRSEAALSGYTLRQFSMANIPLAQKLSDRLSEIEGHFVSVAEVRKRVSKKEIGYDDVVSVIKDLTDEGGMFYNMQETISQSVKAKFKNLRDSLDIMYGEIAESKFGNNLKNIAVALTNLTRNWQELGAAIAAVSAVWFSKKAMSFMNANAYSAYSNSITYLKMQLGSLTATEVRELAYAGKITKQEMLEAVAAKKLSVEEAKLAAAKWNLTEAQLAQVASSGKVDKALLANSISTSKYSVAQLRAIATMREFSLFGSKRMAMALNVIGTNLKMAGAALLSFAKAAAPMVAITAIVEMWMRYKKTAEQTGEAAQDAFLKGSESVKNLSETISKLPKFEISEQGIANLDDGALRNGIKRTIEDLKTYSEISNDIIKKVNATNDDGTPVMSLAEKYNYLREQLEETNRTMEEFQRTSSAQESAIKNTGGLLGADDNVFEDLKDYYNERKSFIEDTNRFYSENRLQVAEAIEAARIEDEGYRQRTEGMKNYAEMLRVLVTESDRFAKAYTTYWNKPNMQGTDFKTAWGNVGGQFNEAKRELDKWAEGFKSTMEGTFGYKFSNLSKEEFNNVRRHIWEFSNSKELGTLDEQTRKWIRDYLGKKWDIQFSSNAEEMLKEFDEMQTHIQDLVGKEWVIKLKLQGVDSFEALYDQLDKDVKEGKETMRKLGTSFSDARKQQITSLATDVNTLTAEEKEYREAYLKTQNAIAAANKEGFKLSSLEEKNTSKGGRSQEDVNARAVRERVRIIKEAADAFQYWRDKVGDKAAWSHVMDEFGDILKKIGITSDNVQDLRGNLDNVLNSDEFKAIKDKKVQAETEKEIAKEKSQLNRKDFEKTAEEFSSKIQIELDSLTRAWEIFNNVREATGNVELAVQISGANYAGGKTRNLADALKEKIQRDFDMSGNGIDFDINLSDKDIEEKIKAAMPKANEDRIKGLVEEYKKWRDLQRDVLKSDISIFTGLVSSAQDYESQLQRINDKLKKQIEANNQLAKNGTISQKEADKANKIATVQAEDEKWKASLTYNQLMNDSLALTREEVENGINRAMEHLNALMQNNLISAQDYANEMEKIRNIQSEWTKNSFFGTNGKVGAYASGGISGLINYYKRLMKKDDAAMASLTQQKGEYDFGLTDKLKENLKIKKTKEGENVEELEDLQDVLNSFEALSKAIEPVINLFDQLGMTSLSGVLSAGQSALSSATSIGGGAAALFGASAGPWGAAIGAGVSILGSILSTHDDSLQEQINAIDREVNALNANTDAIKTFRDRTLGYDTGTLRKLMANQYNNTTRQKTLYLFGKDYTFDYQSAALKAMREFYKMNSGGTGYAQELENLKKQREDYINMYDLEADKKESSQDALDEYKSKIAELDVQIAYFSQDLANELFGIDLKGWADQIGDALMTAFENGEDAAKAFKNSVQDIMRQVLRKMLSIGIIEPMMERLQKKLFGENGKGGSFDANNPEGTIDAAMRDVAEFFGDNGEGQKMIAATQSFYEKWEDLMRSYGMTLADESKSSSATAGIKGITEQTADLIASYINAIRADTSVIRAMSAQYFPMYYAVLTSGNASLKNIENHTSAIMRSNDVIAQKITNLDNNINGLKNKTWKVPMA